MTTAITRENASGGGIRAWYGALIAERCTAMKAPVLVVADTAGGRAIRAALEHDFELTVTESVTRANALRSTGAYAVVFVTRSFADQLPDTVELDAGADARKLGVEVRTALANANNTHYEAARTDDAGTLQHDEYVELGRYAMMRRYLLALLARHNGSVTDAARGASLKRESLHRLMRRYHVNADDFRE